MDVWSVFRCEKEYLCSHLGWWLHSSIPASWHCTLALGPGRGLLKVARTYIPLRTRAHYQLSVLLSAAHEVSLPLSACYSQANQIHLSSASCSCCCRDICLGCWCIPWHAPLGQGVVRFLPSLGGKTGCRMVCWLLQPRQRGLRACVGRVGKPYKQETKITNSFQPGFVSDLGNVLSNLLLC